MGSTNVAWQGSRTDPLGGLLALGFGAAALVAGGALIGRFLQRRRATEGHAPTDLALDRPHPGPRDRAAEAFRPDMDSPMSPGEREALRPATMKPLGAGTVG